MFLSSTIDDVLRSLRPAFSRETPFRLFYLVVFALCVMLEPASVTAVVRVFNLIPEASYRPLLQMFRSKAIDVERIGQLLLEYVLKHAPVKKLHDKPIFAVDSIKAPKEGRRMPGVKRQHQESGDNGKPTYVFAHLFGALSILCEASWAHFALLLRMCLQDGFLTAVKASDEPSQVDKMAALIIHVTQKPSYILADSFYCATNFLTLLRQHDHHVITRARSTTVAYQKPEVPEHKGRGRPPKYGPAVHLKERLAASSQFTKAQVNLNGKSTEAWYHSEVLLWQGIEVLFVYSKLNDGRHAIYLSTDVTLSPLVVIELYASRFGIEHSFKHLVYTVHGFAYRFWTKVQDRKQRLNGSQSLVALEERTRVLLTNTIRAYHIFVSAACVALSSLQLIAVLKPEQVRKGCSLYFRSRGKAMKAPSELMVQHAVQQELSRISPGSRPPLLLWEILEGLQRQEPTHHPLEVVGALPQGPSR